MKPDDFKTTTTPIVPMVDLIFNQAEINAQVGSFSWNLANHELFYSDNFYRILDCEPNEFTPDIDYFNSTFIHPQDKERIEKIRDFTQDSQQAGTWEYRIITKAGTIKHIRAISKTLNLNGNSVLIGTIQDITDDVLKMQQLQKRQEELRITNVENKTSLKVIHNAEISAGLGHWHINLETNEINISENLQKITGYSTKEEITFEKIIDLVHPDDRNNLIETSLKDYQMNRTSVTVFRLIRKDGKIRYLKGTSDKMRILKNSYVIGIAQDITSLIDKEIMLEEKNLQLERQNEELASFNHMASHDLQEPLRKIQVLSKMIMEKEEDNLSDTSKHYFKRIENSAQRMQTLIDDLLSYSRTNHPSSEKVMTDLNLVLKDALQNLKEEISNKRAEIQFESLPTINAISPQILQLFINLIGNALKYSKTDIPPKIKITSQIIAGDLVGGYGLKNMAHYHYINFSDNGIGFDQKYAHKIFEIFQRLHSKDIYSGTGIGLTICKKVVQNHNGYITASSILGEGSSFNLYFPIEDEHEIGYM